jgi:3-methyladenine DNA glycosylase AlkD
MDYEQVVAELESLADPAAAQGMARYGIRGGKVYGVTMPALRRLAKGIGTDHALALRLWTGASRETRILACLVADPKAVDEALMEAWAADFDNWEVCDQCCMGLFERTPYARGKAVEWSARPEEYVKRAGFVLMAHLAVSDKRAPDTVFQAFLPLIQAEAGDPRDQVRKAVSWALRQIGKRNPSLCAEAIAVAEAILAGGIPSARWVATDALRELRSDAVQARLAIRAAHAKES